MKRAIVLLSGGIDSTTLLYFAKRHENVDELYALTFDYGQKHAREIEMALWQAQSARVTAHRVVKIGALGELTGKMSALTGNGMAVPDLAAIKEADRSQPQTYVPNRNMVLLALSAAYAETEGILDIYYGAQRQDKYGYWDCTGEFVAGMNEVFALNHREPVVVHAPFVDMRKSEVVKIGLELGVDYSHTWTCYRGTDVPCGTCPSCVERINAMREAGVKDI
ncbi:MAG: 7-cyano-7-deazaguanine synthase QueC [Lentisphaerae bacterium]|nr:7-cyano-7-deazaguanine synthase QueC [Lentisphaerota bacterium]